MRRLLLVLSFIAALPVAARDVSAQAPTESVSQRSPAEMAPVSRRVDVGGYKLYVKCVGTGAPTIVLDNEYYLDSWNAIQTSLGSYSRTCDYDGEGHALSDAGHASISSALLVRDAYRLLHNGGIPGPYLLVGLNFGGTNMRLYASRHPGDASGLVLIDAVSPELLQYTRVSSANVDVDKSQKQLATAGLLGSLPLVVLSHEIGHCLSRGVEDRWQRFQRGLTRLSVNSIEVEATQSGCDVSGNTPRLVVEVIKHVLIAIRRHTRTSSCSAAFSAFGGICLYSSGRS